MRSALAAGPELVDERAQREAASLELDGRREYRRGLSIPPEVREVTCYRRAIRQHSGCRRVFEQRRLGPVHVSNPRVQGYTKACGSPGQRTRLPYNRIDIVVSECHHLSTA